MSPPYIDGQTLDEAREAHRQGVSLAALAEKLHCNASHLVWLLGLPRAQHVPQADADVECDLWAVDRLEAQL